MKFILFADDTNMFCLANDVEQLENIVCCELNKLRSWFSINKLSLNIAKTNYMLFSGRTRVIQSCLTENDQEKANVLGDFFKSVFVHEDKFTIREFHQRTNECSTDITFTEETVRKKLQSIQPDKAPGPDGLHSRVLKECSSSIGYSASH